MIIKETKEQLFLQIEEKRKELLRLSSIYGIKSRKVLFCSEQLDELINKYQRVCTTKRRKE